MKKARRWLLAAALAALLCLCLLDALPRHGRTAASEHGNGLFSWHADAMEAGRQEDLFSLMKELGLTELYQHIPHTAQREAVRKFLRAAEEEGITVYMLTGDPAWGLDSSGRAMTEEISRAAGYGGLRGVMMDVEPYLTAEWQDDPDSAMERYVQAMTAAKEAADAGGQELVACIPYFYESLGQEERLETLVNRGCHAVAVMNYDKQDEADNLENEAAFAKAYGKPLLTIYELQPPGTQDLTDRNTYYNDGLDALAESWARLERRYGDMRFSYALHEYEALKEVLGD